MNEKNYVYKLYNLLKNISRISFDRCKKDASMGIEIITSNHFKELPKKGLYSDSPHDNIKIKRS